MCLSLRTLPDLASCFSLWSKLHSCTHRQSPSWLLPLWLPLEVLLPVVKGKEVSSFPPTPLPPDVWLDSTVHIRTQQNLYSPGLSPSFLSLQRTFGLIRYLNKFPVTWNFSLLSHPSLMLLMPTPYCFFFPCLRLKLEPYLWQSNCRNRMEHWNISLLSSPAASLSR